MKDVLKPHSVAGQTFLELSGEEQEELRVLAIPVHYLCSKGDFKGAKGHLDSLELDDTYYTAIWSLFDSTQRSKMKGAK